MLSYKTNSQVFDFESSAAPFYDSNQLAQAFILAEK